MMKDIIFPENIESDKIYSNSISSENNGIILVMRSNKFIGYVIFQEYTQSWVFGQSLSDENYEVSGDSLEDLALNLKLRYDDNLYYKFIEFKE